MGEPLRASLKRTQPDVKSSSNRRWLSLGFLCAVILFSPVSWAKSQSQGTLMVLGDSLSAGYGFSLSQSWVSLLAQRVQKADDLPIKPNKVVNASVAGETTAGALTRLPALLKQHQPRWVIVELGGNDGLRGYPPPALESNLLKIVQTIKETTADVLLLGMQLPPNYGLQYTKAFAGTYAQVAQVERLPWVPFFIRSVALEPDLMQSDGIHPKAKAQSHVLDDLWPCLHHWWASSPKTEAVCNPPAALSPTALPPTALPPTAGSPATGLNTSD